jgi:CheY-like chemotaxis protein
VNSIAGKRILVVEDEVLVAAMLEDMLADLGAVVVGSAATVAKGLVIAREAAIDAAVLDVNVRNEPIDPVATVLRNRRIPMVFTTGYGQGAAATAQGAPILDKPYTRDRLAGALAVALSAQR